MRLNFVPPPGWTDTTRPNGLPGFWKNYALRDGTATHSIVLSVTRGSRPAAAYGDASADALKREAGVALLESGPTTTCGDVPAYSYTYRSDRTGHPMIIRHVLADIGPLLGDVSYAHPPDAADRADARDALSTLCDQQIYAPRAPAGWRAGGLTAVGRPGVDAFTAPSGDAVVLAFAVAAPVSMQAKLFGPTQLGAGATAVSSAEEACGTTRVWRTVFRAGSSSGTKITEQVAGYRHGARYVYAYTRPDGTPPDREAERALTSFCDAGATLATPAPQAQTPAPQAPTRAPG